MIAIPLRAPGAVVALALMLASLTGCQTLDPAGDFARASAVVTERSGYSIARSDRLVDLPASQPLNVSDAIRLALANSPSLQSELATVAAARAALVQAGLLPNPVVDISAVFDSGASTLSIGAMQSLSALWLIPSRKQAADAELQRAVLRVSDNALNLAARTEQSHRRVIYLQELVELLGQQEEVLAGSATAAREKMDAGLATIVDVNRLDVERYRVQAEGRAAASDMRTEKQTLSELMGLAERSVEWAARPWPAGPTTLPDESDLIAQARARRLDLLAARWAIQARSADVTQARLGIVPDVGVGPMVERKTEGGMTGNMVGGGLSLSVPLFDQSQARAARAAAELDRARADAATVEQKAIREVRIARQAACTAADQLLAYQRDILPLAGRNVDDLRKAFDAGEADVLDVLTAERMLLEALSAQARFRLQLDIAWSELARATGGLAANAASR